jgi:hypothetical protein
MGKSILPVIAAGTLALAASAHARVAPALGANQQSLSGAQVAPVNQPDQEQHHSQDQPEQKQDERT